MLLVFIEVLLARLDAEEMLYLSKEEIGHIILEVYGDFLRMKQGGKNAYSRELGSAS